MRQWLIGLMLAVSTVSVAAENITPVVPDTLNCAGFRQIEIADGGYVAGFDASPTDSTIAVAGRHGIDVYDTVTLVPVASAPVTLTAGEYLIWVSVVDWSPTGNQIAGSIISSAKTQSSEDAVGVRIGIWKLGDQEMVQLFDIPIPFIEGVSDLSLSPDGRFIAVAAARSAGIYILDATKGEIISIFPYPSDADTSGSRLIDWSPDGKYLALANGTVAISLKTITIISAEDEWKIAETIATQFRQIHSLSWSSDGLLAAVGGAVDIWDVPSRKILTEIFDSNDVHQTIAWSPDGSFLAGGGTYHGKYGVVVYDAQGNHQFTLTGQPFEASSIRWSSEGQRLYSYAATGDSITGYLAYNVYEWNVAKRCLETIFAADIPEF